MRLIIISGRSGSGKTVVLHTLEDLGFYCIDNLPIGLLADLPDALSRDQSQPLVAVSIDSRNFPADVNQLQNILQGLHRPDCQIEIIYLDADDNTLLKRFSETRRKHPLTSYTVSLREAISREHILLTPLADQADLSIDTSPLSVHDLASLIRNRLQNNDGKSMQLLLQSFGFKYGLPPDSDFVFDVRCLPNPYWHKELRPFSGQDPKVVRFLEQEIEVQNMYHDILKFIRNWIPKFVANNRSYMTISIGCTGGKHRSVYLVERIVEEMRDKIANIQLRHREVSPLTQERLANRLQTHF